MNKSCTAYYYVTHKETQQQGFKIAEGEYDGVVFLFKDVRFPIHKEDGSLIDPKDAAEIALTFGYDVLYNPTDEEVITEEFQSVIGDILLNVIEESLEHDQININTENRTDNSDELDS